MRNTPCKPRPRPPLLPVPLGACAAPPPPSPVPEIRAGRDRVPAGGARMTGSVQRYRADKVKKPSAGNSSSAGLPPATFGIRDAQ